MLEGGAGEGPQSAPEFHVALFQVAIHAVLHEALRIRFVDKASAQCGTQASSLSEGTASRASSAFSPSARFPATGWKPAVPNVPTGSEACVPPVQTRSGGRQAPPAKQREEPDAQRNHPASRQARADVVQNRSDGRQNDPDARHARSDALQNDRDGRRNAPDAVPNDSAPAQNDSDARPDDSAERQNGALPWPNDADGRQNRPAKPQSPENTSPERRIIRRGAESSCAAHFLADFGESGFTLDIPAPLRHSREVSCGWPPGASSAAECPPPRR